MSCNVLRYPPSPLIIFLAWLWLWLWLWLGGLFGSALLCSTALLLVFFPPPPPPGPLNAPYPTLPFPPLPSLLSYSSVVSFVPTATYFTHIHPHTSQFNRYSYIRYSSPRSHLQILRGNQHIYRTVPSTQDDSNKINPHSLTHIQHAVNTTIY